MSPLRELFSYKIICIPEFVLENDCLNDTSFEMSVIYTKKIIELRITK